MADFFLDADVDAELVGLLGARGHSAVTTGQAGRLNASDDQQLLLAADLGRQLVTHDKLDYLLLYRAWRSFSRRWGVEPGEHAGIIVVPQKGVMPYSRTAGEIDNLTRSEPNLWGRFWRYETKWGWIVER